MNSGNSNQLYSGNGALGDVAMDWTGDTGIDTGAAGDFIVIDFGNPDRLANASNQLIFVTIPGRPWYGASNSM